MCLSAPPLMFLSLICTVKEMDDVKQQLSRVRQENQELDEELKSSSISNAPHFTYCSI